MGINASRVSGIFDVNATISLRDEGSGAVVADGVEQPINLSSIDGSNLPYWADQARTGRLRAFVKVISRNADGSASFSLKFDNTANMSSAIEVGPVAIPPTFSGLITMDVDLGSDAELINDPVWTALAIYASGGAAVDLHAWLGRKSA